jgi:phage tail-like protein
MTQGEEKDLVEQDQPPDTQQAGGDTRRVSRRGLIGSAAASGLGLAALLQSTRAREAKAQSSGDGNGFFALEIDGETLGAFVEVTGIGSESVVEGGDGVAGPSPASRTKWSNIELKRGVSTNMVLADWREEVEESGSKMKDARKNGSIILYDHVHAEVARWNFVNAWPSKIEVGHAKLLSDDIMILEQLTLSPEKIQRVK